MLSTIRSFRFASKKARQFSRLVGSYRGVPSSLSFKVNLRSLSVGTASLLEAGVSMDFGDRYFSNMSSEVSEKWKSFNNYYSLTLKLLESQHQQTTFSIVNC